MSDHSEHLGRHQLLVMAAVLLGAMLLLVGLLPPQVARGQEQQQQNPTPPHVARGMQQQEPQNPTPPAQDNEQTQTKWVLDKDPQGHEYVAGELLVTYEKGAFKKAKDEAPKKVGAKVEKDFPQIEVQHVSVPEVKNETAQEARQQALERKKQALEQHPDVEAVGYNYVGYGTMTPTDPDYGKQWAPPKINAPGAWDTTQGSSSVRIAILDSGLETDHPEFTGKVVGQYDFVNKDSYAYDDVGGGGHGTLTAGIAAASANNGEYGAGTCPKCSLLVGKVLDSSNSLGTSWAWAIDGINWATLNGADVINMSFAGGAGDPALERAINNAWNSGAVVVGAAGNNGTDGKAYYPAAYPNVIAVGATDKDDNRAYYEWKPGEYQVAVRTDTGSCCLYKYYEASNAGSFVDVAAPGKAIYTTRDGWWYEPTDSDKYYYQDGSVDDAWGTSMAAPHVSGLAGLILSKDGSLSPAQVRYQIESTAKDLGTAGKDDVFGNGLINAQAALKFTSRTHQENDAAIAYNGAGDWTKYAWSGASGGYTNWAYRSGATATFTFTGNSVSWWANKGSWAGKAYVYVDGYHLQTVDLYASSDRPSQPVYTKSWPTSGTHTIKVYVEGTSGRPWVDVDRFTVTQRT